MALVASTLGSRAPAFRGVLSIVFGAGVMLVAVLSLLGYRSNRYLIRDLKRLHAL
jgi:hypothetical protein